MKYELLWFIGAVLLICLIVGTINTLRSFKPNAEAIMSEQAVMQRKLDSLQSELTHISEAVESYGKR